MATRTGEIVDPKDAIKSIRKLLETNKGQIAMALPRHITVDRLLRVALTSIQKTPKLLKCEPITLFGAILQSAQLGLMPDGMAGEAYLVPFWNTKKNRRDVQLIPGYRGLLSLVRRSGNLSTFCAAAVHKMDLFEYELGLNPILKHKPHEGPDDPGPLTHVYAIARMKDGGVQFEVMSKGQVDKIRGRSKSADDGPWVTDYEEMAKKTVTKRIAKYLPSSAELQMAVSLDEKAERDIPQDLGSLVDFTEAETIDEETGEVTQAEKPGPAPNPEKAEPGAATTKPTNTPPQSTGKRAVRI